MSLLQLNHANIDAADTNAIQLPSNKGPTGQSGNHVRLPLEEKLRLRQVATTVSPPPHPLFLTIYSFILSLFKRLFIILTSL